MRSCPLQSTNTPALQVCRRSCPFQSTNTPAFSTPHAIRSFTHAAPPLLLQSKALVDKLEGADAAELSSRVERLRKAEAGAGGQALKQLEGLRARLTRLITASPVMLFMKGTPNEPRCKFSRRAVDMLKEMGVPFGSFGERDTTSCCNNRPFYYCLLCRSLRFISHQPSAILVVDLVRCRRLAT